MAERDLVLSEIMAISRGLLATVVEREGTERPVALRPFETAWGAFPARFQAKPIADLYSKRYRRLADVFDVPSFLRDAILTDFLKGDVPSQWLYDTVKSWTTLTSSVPEPVLDFWIYTLVANQEPEVSCLRLAINQLAMGYEEPELRAKIREVLGKIMQDDPRSRDIRLWTLDGPDANNPFNGVF